MVKRKKKKLKNILNGCLLQCVRNSQLMEAPSSITTRPLDSVMTQFPPPVKTIKEAKERANTFDSRTWQRCSLTFPSEAGNLLQHCRSSRSKHSSFYTAVFEGMLCTFTAWPLCHEACGCVLVPIPAEAGNATAHQGRGAGTGQAKESDDPPAIHALNLH